jgi:formylglycine-generating enzyme required for sulfatase activity
MRSHRARIIPVGLAILILAINFGLHAAGDMIRIPGATFMMGSDDGNLDERPRHKVSVEPFLLDRIEVTNAQLAAYLNAHKHGHKGPNGERYFDLGDNDARIGQLKNGQYAPFKGHERKPVTEVSWLAARDYCAVLGKRLPTEAEWEFAARGPEGRKYPWGNEEPKEKGEKTRAHFAQEWGDMAPVDAYPSGATPQGVLGMAGNVHEWTSSASEAYPYKADDGREAMSYSADRVTRGGAHDSTPNELRASWRGATVSRNPMAGHHGIGFRCAKSGSK